jgi:hypothetical protein
MTLRAGWGAPLTRATMAQEATRPVVRQSRAGDGGRVSDAAVRKEQ